MTAHRASGRYNDRRAVQSAHDAYWPRVVSDPSRLTVTPAPRACYTPIGHISIDREFVTSPKKFANFNEFSEIKKFIKIRTQIR